MPAHWFSLLFYFPELVSWTSVIRPWTFTPIPLWRADPWEPLLSLIPPLECLGGPLLAVSNFPWLTLAHDFFFAKPFYPAANNPRGFFVWKFKLPRPRSMFYCLPSILSLLFFFLSWCSAPSCCFYSCCSNFNEDNQCLLCLFKKQIRT